MSCIQELPSPLLTSLSPTANPSHLLSLNVSVGQCVKRRALHHLSLASSLSTCPLFFNFHTSDLQHSLSLHYVSVPVEWFIGLPKKFQISPKNQYK